jgi:hypothetical protein
MALKGRSGSLRLSANKLESNTQENIMTRISTFCVVSSTLTVLALSTNGASAGSPTVTTVRPTMNFHPSAQQPKATSKITVRKVWDSSSPSIWAHAYSTNVNPSVSKQLGVRYNPPKN